MITNEFFDSEAVLALRKISYTTLHREHCLRLRLPQCSKTSLRSCRSDLHVVSRLLVDFSSPRRMQLTKS